MSSGHALAYRQAVAPEGMLGRIGASDGIIGYGGIPLGAVLGGLAGETFGVRIDLVACSVRLLSAAASALISPLRGVRERAASLAVRGGARFYAAGRDATFPMPDGPWPATGAVLAAVEVASGRQALAIGKPAAYMFEIARAIAGRELRLAVVGDRLDSDIEGGKRAGLFTILVLTGSTRVEALADAAVTPDLVVADLLALLGPERTEAEP